VCCSHSSIAAADLPARCQGLMGAGFAVALRFCPLHFKAWPALLRARIKQAMPCRRGVRRHGVSLDRRLRENWAGQKLPVISDAPCLHE
jgi:hypothetical protein